MIHAFSPPIETLFIHPGKTLPDISSLVIAKILGKRHSAVLRSIRRLIRCHMPEAIRGFYVPTSYRNCQGKNLPAYQCKQDGVCLLLMSDNSPKAIRWKCHFVENSVDMAARVSPELFDLFREGDEQ